MSYFCKSGKREFFSFHDFSEDQIQLFRKMGEKLSAAITAQCFQISNHSLVQVQTAIGSKNPQVFRTLSTEMAKISKVKVEISKNREN